MPADNPIAALIQTLDRASVPRPSIRHAVDPKDPNHIVYSITGQTRDAVQAVITDLMNKVGDGFGQADFFGPLRDNGVWVAVGEVIVFEPSVTL